jgi:hypothetical protein
MAVLAGWRGRICGIPSTKGAKTPFIVPIVPRSPSTCSSVSSRAVRRALTASVPDARRPLPALLQVLDCEIDLVVRAKAA